MCFVNGSSCRIVGYTLLLNLLHVRSYCNSLYFVPMLRCRMLLLVVRLGSVSHWGFFRRQRVRYIWRLSFPHRSCPMCVLCSTHCHVGVVFSSFGSPFVVHWCYHFVVMRVFRVSPNCCFGFLAFVCL